MLCEIAEGKSFPVIWLSLAGIAEFSVLGLSSLVFYMLYWRPSYNTWRWKVNPKYPPPAVVRDEIFQCNKGMVMAVLCPAITIWLSTRGYAKGFCGGGGMNVWQHVATQFAFWLFVDFFSFYYHRATHVYRWLWNFHKFHHLFYNPTPFAVIADEFVDQLVRASPMILYPLVLPINIDLMFFQMGVFSYAYGVYLHSGHELSWPDAHHPHINSSFSHYIHHAASVYNKPYHCGFFLKFFDQWWGSVYPRKCVCAKCSQQAGERSVEKWDALPKPDYSPMLTLPFWIEGLKKEAKSLADTSTNFLRSLVGFF